MSLPITLSSVIPPRRRSNILTRPRLLDKLQGSLENRLLLLSAPAGYGKTSLLVDFLHTSNVSACWYTVDRTDNHLIVFLMHFIGAIQYHYPGVGQAAEIVVCQADQVNFDLDQIVTPLVNDIQNLNVEQLVIVVDDFHHTSHNPRIAAFISRFVQRAGDKCLLILSSRKQPELPDLELMAGRSQLGIIMPGDLLFTVPEIQALIWQNHHMRIADEQAEQLHLVTGGWIAPLLLSAPEQWASIFETSQMVKISGASLYDYLGRQVLAHQTREIQDFLLFSALLGDFDVDLCTDVLGATVYSPDTDWGALLETITGEYMLARQIGEHGTKLRYNQLFENFLQKQALMVYPEQARRIQIKLAEVCELRGAWEKAWDAYGKLGNQERQGFVIEQAATMFIKQGRFNTLSQWLNELPSEMISANPHLLSIQGAVTSMREGVEQATPYLDRAIELFHNRKDYAGLGRALARRATLMFFQGNYQAALSDANQIIELVSSLPEQHLLLADALNSKGISLIWLGDPDTGLSCLNQALGLYQEYEDELNCAVVRQDMGIAYRNMGKYQQARDNYQAALVVWAKIGDLHKSAGVHNNLGALDYYDGNYISAVDHFQATIKLSDQSGYTRIKGYSLIGMGDVYADLGAVLQAHRAYSQAANLPSTMNTNLMLYVYLGEARLARMKQDWVAAESMMQSAQVILDKYPSAYEQGLYMLESGLQAIGRGQHLDALNLFQQATRMLESAKKVGEAAQAYLYLASTQFRLHQPSARVTLWRALEIASMIESHHIMMMAGRDCIPLLENFRSDPGLKAQIENLLSRIEQFDRSRASLLQRLRNTVEILPNEQAHLVFKGFGEGQAYLDGRLLGNADWVSSFVSKEALFYLLSHPEGLTRGAASLIFWTESDANQVATMLRTTRYRLRKALGQDIVLPVEEKLIFNFALDYQYDVEDFRRLIEQAQAEPENKEKHLDQAVKLYTNHFLYDTLHDWTNPIRDNLLALYLSSALDLGEAAIRNHKFEQSLEYSWMALRLDPTAEAIHRLVMRTYAAMGLRSDAIKQYKTCCQALRSHLGISPSDETEQLYRSLAK